tara:strand:- start:13235 stop:13759 length:525 start_codon:yes stop_codon:yes gene_type:complete
MHKIFFTFFIAIFAISPISAEEKQKIPTFGDWAKKCETAKIREQNKEGVTDKKICYVFQNVSNKESGQIIMQVRIGYPASNDSPVIIVTLPLGALLPPGAGFLAEGSDPLKLPFLACGREGCTTVGQPIKSKMLEAMKKGDRAAVRVSLMNQKVINLPVSLKGFTRALNSIKSK